MPDPRLPGTLVGIIIGVLLAIALITMLVVLVLRRRADGSEDKQPSSARGVGVDNPMYAVPAEGGGSLMMSAQPGAAPRAVAVIENPTYAVPAEGGGSLIYATTVKMAGTGGSSDADVYNDPMYMGSSVSEGGSVRQLRDDFWTVSRAFAAPTHPMLPVCFGLRIVHADRELIGA